MRVVVAEGLGQRLQLVLQQQIVGAGSDRQFDLVAIKKERSLFIRHADLAALEHRPILVAEDRQQHLVLQARVDRPPVNVEVGCIHGAGTVFQNVHPPGVGRMVDAHVIGHHVDQPFHAVLAESGRERVESLLAAEFGVEPAVVRYVVTVRTARPCLQDGRRVDIAEAQFGEIGNQFAGLDEVELRIQLEAVGCAGGVAVGNEVFDDVTK